MTALQRRAPNAVTFQSMAVSHRPTAVAGLLGVTLNILAVIALRPVPDTYAPGNVPAWLAEARAVPLNIAISGSAFTLGLVALAAFMAGLAFRGATRQSWWVIGASLCGAGALLDAAGTMAPVAALHTSTEVGIGLLWLTLVLDSSFNALLGFGLICLSVAQISDDGWPKPLRWLALAAGLASAPVCLQFISDSFAKLLFYAAPLWVAWVVWTCVVLLRPAAVRR